MIRNTKILYIIVTASLFLFGTGCKKYLDVNQNKNNPTSLPVSVLITSTEQSLANNISMGTTLGNGLACYIHWHAVRGGADAYGYKGDQMSGTWSSFYSTIANLNVIAKQGTAEGRYVYAGIAKILKAYTFSLMVDIWGDIPFSEFDQFQSGIKQPHFDKDAAIYPQLFTLLDAGIADINNPAVNPSLPGNDEVIYKGNKSRWIKAANTIKLKLYTQMRRVQNVTPQVTALLASPSTLISATKDESFMLPYGPLSASGDDRNPGWFDYTATQKNTHVSPWLYEIMKGISPNPYVSVFNGIADPRLPYYVFNQTAIVNPATPPNTTEYRDGPFISLYFASRGPNRDGSQQNAISLFGIYPVGGRYDDGLGQVTSNASGTGAAPCRFITYADRLYLEAELINTGVIAGDARAVLNAAMAASFAQVDYVVSLVAPPQTVPSLMGANGATPTAAVTSYINSILALYDAGSTAKKLEIIMTQKWLSQVGFSLDAYTDYRRTGYPILFDPNNALMAPGGRVQPPLNGNPILNALGQTQPTVPVVLTTRYPESLPWSQQEKELNANAPAQKQDPSTYKIFWKP